MELKAKELLDKWCQLVAQSSLEELLDLYLDDAQLKPTLSNAIRRKKGDIVPYFEEGGKFDDLDF
ncbi:MAG: hypothetical protein R2827_08480 [Bdellovibrionales bacterium]